MHRCRRTAAPGHARRQTAKDLNPRAQWAFPKLPQGLSLALEISEKRRSGLFQYNQSHVLPIVNIRFVPLFPFTKRPPACGNINSKESTVKAGGCRRKGSLRSDPTLRAARDPHLQIPTSICEGCHLSCLGFKGLDCFLCLPLCRLSLYSLCAPLKLSEAKEEDGILTLLGAEQNQRRGDNSGPGEFRVRVASSTV